MQHVLQSSNHLQVKTLAAQGLFIELMTAYIRLSRGTVVVIRGSDGPSSHHSASLPLDASKLLQSGSFWRFWAESGQEESVSSGLGFPGQADNHSKL